MATHCSILAWRCHGQSGLVGYAVHGVAKSWTQLSDFHFTITCQTKKTKSWICGASEGTDKTEKLRKEGKIRRKREKLKQF